MSDIQKTKSCNFKFEIHNLHLVNLSLKTFHILSSVHGHKTIRSESMVLRHGQSEIKPHQLTMEGHFDKTIHCQYKY